MAIERPYWNNRYRDGLRSGDATRGRYRRWKWSIILKYVGTLSSVVDVGCGDMDFWKLWPILNRLRRCDSYVGIDISDLRVRENRRMWPDRKFISANSATRIDGLRARLVLAMNLLFHVMDPGDFIKTIDNLCLYSDEWVIIKTWVKCPFVDGVTDGVYQYYRRLEDYMDILFSHGFALIEKVPSPFDDLNAIYVFKRVA